MSEWEGRLRGWVVPRPGVSRSPWRVSAASIFAPHLADRLRCQEPASCSAVCEEPAQSEQQPCKACRFSGGHVRQLCLPCQTTHSSFSHARSDATCSP